MKKMRRCSPAIQEAKRASSAGAGVTATACSAIIIILNIRTRDGRQRITDLSAFLTRRAVIFSSAQWSGRANGGGARCVLHGWRQIGATATERGMNRGGPGGAGKNGKRQGLNPI